MVFESPPAFSPRAFPEDVQEAITTECQAKYHAYAAGEPGNGMEPDGTGKPEIGVEPFRTRVENLGK